MSNNFHYYEDSKIPYYVSQVCDCVTQYAKEYVQEADRMIDNIDTKVRDVVLVDAINYLGGIGHIYFGLGIKNLYDEKTYEKEVAPQCLLTTLVTQYGYYIFSLGIVKSVLRNKYNGCDEPFDDKDGAIVLIDFINYVAEKNNYDKRFTIEDIFERLASVLKDPYRKNKLKENAYAYIDLFEDGESFILGDIENNDMEHSSKCIELKKQSLSDLVKEIDTINGPSGVTKTKRIPTNKEYRESVKRANERIKAGHDAYSNAKLQAKNVYVLKRTK